MATGTPDHPGHGPHPVYVVAPDGDDRNPGTQELPFATLEQARQTVRDVIAGGMTSDIVVQLRGGTYLLPHTITFDEHDAGRDGYRVIYMNYPGETPVLVGGERITGWVRQDDGICRADVSELIRRTGPFHQLFANGERQRKARYPNAGYLRAARGSADRQRQFTEFAFLPGDLPEWNDLSGAQVTIWARHDWFHSTIPVTQIDHAASRITLATRAEQFIRPRNRYAVQGVREALDQPGEFYLDEAEGLLYTHPGEHPVDALDIIAPTLDTLIAFHGSSPATPVEQITVEGLTVTISRFTDTFNESDTIFNRPARGNRKGLAYLENARRIAIRHNRLSHAGFNGIVLHLHAADNEVYGNAIHDAGYHGVLLIGTRMGVLDAYQQQVFDNRRNRIANNHIHHCGRLVGHAGGIFLNQSGENEISHNRIHDMPRYGICLKGRVYKPEGPTFSGQMPMTVGDGIPVTWATHLDYQTGRSNTFAFNDISHVNQDSEDSGLITLWGAGPHNEIRNNYLHDVARDWGMNKGIYLDNSTHYTLVSHNIVENITHGPDRLIAAELARTLDPIERVALLNVKGIHNRVVNNIITSPHGAGIFSRYHGGRADEHHYARNIFYLRGDAVFMNVFAWTPYRVASSDHNIFFHTEGLETVRNIPGGSTLANWQSMSPFLIDDHGGSVTVEQPSTTEPKRVQLVVREGTDRAVSITRAFYDQPIDHHFTATWRMRVAQPGGDLVAELLHDEVGRAVAVILAADGTLSYLDSDGQRQPITTGAPDHWHALLVEINTHTGTLRISVDDTLYVADIAMESPCTTLNRFRLRAEAPGRYELADLKLSVPGEVIVAESFEHYRTGRPPTFDQHSLVADPRFVDPDRGDYRLQPDSPAHQIGFQPIDQTAIGLKPDFRLRD